LTLLINKSNFILTISFKVKMRDEEEKKAEVEAIKQRMAAVEAEAAEKAEKAAAQAVTDKIATAAAEASLVSDKDANSRTAPAVIRPTVIETPTEGDTVTTPTRETAKQPAAQKQAAAQPAAPSTQQERGSRMQRNNSAAGEAASASYEADAVRQGAVAARQGGEQAATTESKPAEQPPSKPPRRVPMRTHKAAPDEDAKMAQAQAQATLAETAAKKGGRKAADLARRERKDLMGQGLMDANKPETYNITPALAEAAAAAMKDSGMTMEPQSATSGISIQAPTTQKEPGQGQDQESGSQQR
jgi:hypothetical protein